MAQTSFNFKLEDYYHFLNRRKWLMLIPFLLIIVISVLTIIFSPRVYESYATIQIEQPNINNPLVKGLAVTPEDVVQINTLQFKILSRSQIEQVVKTLHLGDNIKNNPVEFEKLVMSISDNLQVTLMGQNMFQVSFSGMNPQTVMQVVDTLVTNFISGSMQSQQEDTMGALSFIKGQVEEYRTRMEGAEAALRTFKEKHLLELPGNITNNLQQLSNAQASLQSTDLELQQMKMRLTSLNKQLAEHKEIVVSEITKETNPLVVSLRQKIAELEIQLTSLRGQYTDKHPKIIELKDEIARTKEKLEKESENTVSKEVSSINPLYQNLSQQVEEAQIKIETLTAMKKELEQTVKKLESSVGTMPEQEQELARLTRNSAVYTNLYNLYLNKLEEARASRELEVQQKTVRYQIIDHARLPVKPVKPKPIKIIFLGLVMGALVGCGTGLAAEYLNQTVRSVEELQQFTKIPVLGYVFPMITIVERRRRTRLRFIYFFSALIIFVALVYFGTKYYPALHVLIFQTKSM